MKEKEANEELKKILNLAVQENWSDSKFSQEKAYICAKLSEIVYAETSEGELLYNRTLIFPEPSSEYIKNLGNQETSSLFDWTPNEIVQGMLARVIPINTSRQDKERRESKGEEQEVSISIIIGTYSITIVVSFRDIQNKETVIYAIRGTVHLYDWQINLNAHKYYSLCPFHNGIFYHKGFYKATKHELEKVLDLPFKNTNNVKNIIWTGHSLGGAMAGISNQITHYLFQNTYAYTFGSPRFSNIYTSTLYHLYNSQDIVPELPLKNWGYQNPPNEYIIDDGNILKQSRSNEINAFGELFSYEHFIALYSLVIKISSYKFIRLFLNKKKKYKSNSLLVFILRMFIFFIFIGFITYECGIITFLMHILGTSILIFLMIKVKNRTEPVLRFLKHISHHHQIENYVQKIRK